jgi:hypothetical protein
MYQLYLTYIDQAFFVDIDKINFESTDISSYYAKIRETTTWLYNKIVYMITMSLKLRFIGYATQLKKSIKMDTNSKHEALNCRTYDCTFF